MDREDIIELGKATYDERNISPSLFGASSKNLNQWIGSKIVPFVPVQQALDENHKKGDPVDGLKKQEKDQPIGKWIKLNSVQAVWLCIVNELYNFKVSNEKLERLAHKIWQQPREKKYADGVFKYYLKPENQQKAPKEAIEKLRRMLDVGEDEYEILMEHYFRTIINPFTDMVKKALSGDKLPYHMLYVPETEDYFFRYKPLDMALRLQSVFLQKPMVCIPLIPIFKKILLLEFEDEQITDIGYLNQVEKQIRDIVVFKKPESVVITFEERSIKTITVTEEHKTREQLAEYILHNKIKKGSKMLIDIRSNGNYSIKLLKKEVVKA